jgi:endonuclease III
MSRLDLAGEQELRLNKLLDKMQKWLFQQPEWLDLMALDRGTRRRTADLVAKELLKLPVRTVDYPVNRAMRRVIAAEIKAKGGKA